MRMFIYIFLRYFFIMVFFVATVLPGAKWMSGEWESWVLYSYFITLPAWCAALTIYNRK